MSELTYREAQLSSRLRAGKPDDTEEISEVKRQLADIVDYRPNLLEHQHNGWARGYVAAKNKLWRLQVPRREYNLKIEVVGYL